MSKKCPECSSENVYYSKKKNIWICEDCDLEFVMNGSSALCIFKENLDSDEYWSFGLWDVAPTALAMSYYQLYEYVKKQNIGCILFLIRDVFELMIKIPVTIIFNGIHELNKDNITFKDYLSQNTNAFKLYEYSMQMLSTGKWWECVRLASSMDGRWFNQNTTDMKTDALYIDTIQYLKELYEKLYFKISGKHRVNMVTWRNRTIGHSCFANNPVEKYSEIPYILKMFKLVGDISVKYYKKVCLTNGKKKLLRGIQVDKAEPEVYIQYLEVDRGEVFYTKIHNFIAGRNNSLSCFDGFEKGKAYLLNYGNGERYKDQHLSEWLFHRHKVLEAESMKVVLSNENVFADNLETRDINNLEEQLSVQDDIIGVSFLGKWIMDVVNSSRGGMLLLTAERGLGKSTFCSSIDPFENLEIKYDDELYAEKLEDFLGVFGSVAVRVWHFNSEYRSRKDIFIPGIRDELLTLDSINGNKICGRLESQYNNLLSCAEDLRSLYFTECLNNTISEYRIRTDKKKLLLILDGIDEVSDIEELCSFLPDSLRLEEDIYILLTCRTKQEIVDNRVLTEFIDKSDFESILNFTRETITVVNLTGQEMHTENMEYRDIVVQYVEKILHEQKVEISMKRIFEIATSFEYRFSSLAAYRKLCKLSSAFNDKIGTDLFEVFINQIEINAPEAYINRLKCILNTLVCVGEPITLRELAFLSGERYISYRLLGMMNDIQAFIKVTRSSRGNCYELSHSQWEDAVRSLVPYGDIYFRKQCNELLAEMEVFFNEDNISLFLEKTYEGELWLLKHILGIYNRNWKELKENWFEEVRIGSFEHLILLFLNNKEILDKYFSLSNIDEPFGLMKNYSMALETFGPDLNGIRGSKEEKLFVTSPILLEIPQIYARLYESMNKNEDKQKIVRNLADAWNLVADYTNNEVDKEIFRKNSLEAYKLLLELLNQDNNMEQYAMCLYNIGREYQLLDMNLDAYEYLIKFVNLVSKHDNVSYDIKEYLCRTYIRIGRIQKDLGKSEDIFECYTKALKLSKKLVQEYECENYLDTLAWSEKEMSKYYEDSTDIDRAILYREKSFATVQYLISMSPKRKYENDRYYSLYKLGILYEKNYRYKEAIEVAEEALFMEERGFSAYQDELLELLIRVYGLIDKKIKVQQYTDLLESNRMMIKMYKKAYTEVLEVLNYMEKKVVNKIPREFIEFLKKHADYKYKFVLDPSKSLDVQLSRMAIIIFSIIGTSFWSEKYNDISLYNQNDEADKLKKWIIIQDEIHKINNYQNIVETLIQREQWVFFQEAYSVLEKLPQNIISQVPIKMIIWLRNYKRKSTNLTVASLDDLSQEVFAILKYVLGDLV